MAEFEKPIEVVLLPFGVSEHDVDPFITKSVSLDEARDTSQTLLQKMDMRGFVVYLGQIVDEEQ
eukprot:gene20126-7191_t